MFLFISKPVAFGFLERTAETPCLGLIGAFIPRLGGGGIERCAFCVLGFVKPLTLLPVERSRNPVCLVLYVAVAYFLHGLHR